MRVLFAAGDVLAGHAADQPLHPCSARDSSGRDLILIGGGLFLVGKATHGMLDRTEVDHSQPGRSPASVATVIFQILALDMVFSLDSVITAVGMARAVRS